jgi:hypothetical protein
MRRTPILLVAILVVELGPEGGSILRGQEKPSAPAIRVSEPHGWWLNINSDGSGRLGYGSSAMDAWKFAAGTFDVETVTKDLKALPTDEKGKIGSHFVFFFESEREGPERPGPARYTRETKVIPTLFQKAKEAGRVAESRRGALLWEQRTPGLPKEK